jgi:hypothetical protein
LECSLITERNLSKKLPFSLINSFLITHKNPGEMCDRPVLGSGATAVDKGTFLNAYAVRTTQLFWELQAPGSLLLHTSEDYIENIL